jgi:hypothetical protein
MVHLWLGINTRSKALHVGRLNPRDSSVGWPDDQPLERVIASQFRQKTLIAIEDELSFNDSFTVVNLKDICLVQIWWTDNLFDHLKLEGPRGKRILSMYRRKPCLINHCNADSSAIFGIDVVEEAIRTLDLLFLFGDTKTRKFLGEEGVRFHNTRPSRLSKPTNLCEFHYWRGNLGLLLKLLNGPPESLSQTLLDTRSYSEFASLWCGLFGIFLLTIIFGILSAVFSAKQYYLALAVACQSIPTPLRQVGQDYLRHLPR